MALVKRADERFEIKQRLYAAFAASDPHERLDRAIAVWLDFVREILPVASDLVRLRSTDPEAAAAWEDRMSELRAWLAELVGSFRKDGALAPDWSVEEATDYLWAAISVQIWSLLTQDCGWAPERAEKAMQAAKDSGDINYHDLVADEGVAKVSVVGIGMRSHTGVAAQMFRVLSAEGVNIKVITTSEIKISVLIDRKYMELAVQALHDAFELEKAG